MASILERNKTLGAAKKTRSDYAEDALYREVWEDVNNDKTMAFVKKYSQPIMTVAIIILVIVAGIGFIKRQIIANNIATAQNYEMAISNMDSRALANLGRKSSGRTADLALFQSYMMDGDITKLETLARDGNTVDFRDLAKLHIVGKRVAFVGLGVSNTGLIKLIIPIVLSTIVMPSNFKNI